MKEKKFDYFISGDKDTWEVIIGLEVHAQVLSESKLWSSLLLVVLVDDILQYWYHRMAHKWDWLWKLHRPHHVAREMGILVSYRNALLYYMLMPNIWWLGVCSYFGLYQQVLIAVILKQLNQEMSTWIPNSELSRFNQSTSLEPIESDSLKSADRNIHIRDYAV